MEVRRRHKLGPVRIGARLGIAPSTVWRVLCRHGLNRLAWMDRPTGRVIRRYERDTPGELLHIDIKQLGRIPDGGGHRVRGRGYPGEGAKTRRVGYTYLHAAVDDHSRLAYVEAHPDLTAATSIGFTLRATEWLATLGITVEGVMTDNASNYTAYLYRDTLDANGIRHVRIPPRRPQLNGKVERFNRTLLDEWAYVRVYRSESERLEALADWIHTYNHHRHHTAIGGPPISRATNPADQYT